VSQFHLLEKVWVYPLARGFPEWNGPGKIRTRTYCQKGKPSKHECKLLYIVATISILIG